jgi:hypothetical protein
VGVKAVVLKCPNCNANLEIASTVVSVTCTYCGVVAKLQAKTVMFQIPKPPQAPATQQPKIIYVPMPGVAKRSALFAVIPMLVVFGVIGAGIFFATKGIKAMQGKTLWAGEVPALVDIDGDGVPDPVGFVRYVMDNDRAHLAAFSGKTGASLWESEALGKYSDLGQLSLAPLGTMVLIASDKGTLVARDTKNKGAVAWQQTLGEKIDAMCARGNEVVIHTADDKWFSLDAKGQKKTAPKLVRLDHDYTNDQARVTFDRLGGEAGDVCVPTGKVWRGPPGVVSLHRWHDLANIPGMNIEMLVRKPGGPAIALGHKQPGTNVPMIARIATQTPLAMSPSETGGKKKPRREEKDSLPGAAWVTEIPSIDPLNSRFDDKHFALTDKLAIALYQGANSTYRLTAFDLESGKRMWDRQLSTGSGFTPVCLVIAGDAVLISTWQTLVAFALADGADRFSVGSG